MSYGADDEEILRQFYENCQMAATVQGRLSYLLMSLHVTNPQVLMSIIHRDPTRFLYTNMIYGIGVMIYSRPNMRPIGSFNRISFSSILGSLMFNYSSYYFFNFIKERFSERPYLATFLGFLAGRVFMLHLLAYLYHIDIRARDRGVPRNPAFDGMYLS